MATPFAGALLGIALLMGLAMWVGLHVFIWLKVWEETNSSALAFVALIVAIVVLDIIPWILGIWDMFIPDLSCAPYAC